MKFLNLKNILIVVLLAGLLGAVWIWQSAPSAHLTDDAGRFDTQSFKEFARGEVVEILSEQTDDPGPNQTLYQQLSVRLLSGPKKGEVIETEFTRILDSAASVKFNAGDKIVLGYLPPTPSDELLFGEVAVGEYVIVDRLRTTGLALVVALFVGLAIVVGRRQGALSLLALVVAGAILIFFTAPQLLAGKNALMVSGVSAGLIAIITMFIAHGYNLRTRLSVVSTLLSLLAAFAVSYSFVAVAQLFGLGQSDAFALQAGLLGQIDLRGVLLGGLIISLLGILDDVTTTQTAAVEELLKANPALSRAKLFAAGMSVGREHIASLINTLILVYVGASLPLFLLLVAATDQPLWVLLNSEYMAEEIVRALAGSVALVLAVPIATILAAHIYKKRA